MLIVIDFVLKVILPKNPKYILDYLFFMLNLAAMGLTASEPRCDLNKVKPWGWRQRFSVQKRKEASV